MCILRMRFHTKSSIMIPVKWNETFEKVHADWEDFLRPEKLTDLHIFSCVDNTET